MANQKYLETPILSSTPSHPPPSLQVAGNAAGDDKGALDEMPMPDLKRCASAPPLPTVLGGRSPLPVLPSFVMDSASGSSMTSARQRAHSHQRQPSNGPANGAQK